MPSIPKSVAPSLAPSAGGTEILTAPQLGPNLPMTGSAVSPVVPRSDDQAKQGTTDQPGYGRTGETAGSFTGGSAGAPSLPLDGYLFRKGPIDAHYQSESQGREPYRRVNSPPTRGMLTFVLTYLNHIAFSAQEVDANGFRARPAQQRTSYMRVTPPPHGGGYAPETYAPRQLPQHPLTYRYGPQTGTDPYGSGVLNSSTYGAGQTAGGIGGSQYRPSPGPPLTSSTADTPGSVSAMPVWG